jgi:hypothetical protein
MPLVTPVELFADHPGALAVYERVRSILDEIGPVAERTTRSQVVFRHGRAFAFLWRPGQWLAQPGAETVLSIALDSRIESRRFEIGSLDDLDDEVRAWLRAAYGRADRPTRVRQPRGSARPARG